MLVDLIRGLSLGVAGAALLLATLAAPVVLIPVACLIGTGYIASQCIKADLAVEAGYAAARKGR